MEDKYIATIVLHALGDTIGYKNGYWKEIKYINQNLTIEILYDFISQGGINQINIENWILSNISLFHMGIAHALIDNAVMNDSKSNNSESENSSSDKSKNSEKDDLLSDIKNYFMSIYNGIMSDLKKGKNRNIGSTMKKYIQKFPNDDARKDPFDILSGGNACAVRSSCIGLAFYGEENREKLINIAIESSRITHNSPIGYLGGLSVAFFVALAIEGVNYISWPEKLLALLSTKSVKKFIRDKEESKEYGNYIKYWEKYIDLRFDDGIPIKSKAQKNLIFRSSFHYDNFTKNTPGNVLGDSGFSSVIMAYDALLDAEDKFETLLIYSSLHWGDSEATGAIACSFYGALYGFKNTSEIMKKIEFYDKQKELGKKLFDKYYKL
jgi:ADP-ribosylglycohydrolase